MFRAQTTMVSLSGLIGPSATTKLFGSCGPARNQRLPAPGTSPEVEEHLWRDTRTSVTSVDTRLTRGRPWSVVSCTGRIS